MEKTLSSSNVGGLPSSHRQLVDDVWGALQSACDRNYVALASKGSLHNIAEGLSDMDFRLVLDAADPAFWRRAVGAVANAMRDFAHANPSHWRLVEHLPAMGFCCDELNRPPACWEYPEWVILAESTPGHLNIIPDPPPTAWHLDRFRKYRPPYNPLRDPPINVTNRWLNHFPVFSLTWHYYAPALVAGANALGNKVKTKHEAIEWRSRSSPVAREVAALLLGGFPPGPIPEGLDRRCEEDVQRLAEELASGPDVWSTLEEKAVLPMSSGEQLTMLRALLRTFPERWQFYQEVPEGYELDRVLRIDRDHLKMLLNLAKDVGIRKRVNPAIVSSDLDKALAELRSHAQSREEGNARTCFAKMRRSLRVLREAVDATAAEP